MVYFYALLNSFFVNVMFFYQILEPCSNSIAYQPPNPWTMGILGLLAEIYAMPNLKMNLKFEIEVTPYPGSCYYLLDVPGS